jgi:hypothetical protein
MKVVSRAEWKARPPKSRRAIKNSDVTHFFLHHAAATYKSGADAMRKIQAFHQDGRGWADYAYNFGVWEDGTIYEGRGFGAQGGHTRGWNTKSVAVCYMGDGGKPVSKPALDAILMVADAADAYFGKNLIRQAHRDVGSTACPGNVLYEWWKDAPQRLSDAAGEAEAPAPVRGHPDVREGWRRFVGRMPHRRPR